jgi:hypothetical protein
MYITLEIYKQNGLQVFKFQKYVPPMFNSSEKCHRYSHHPTVTSREVLVNLNLEKVVTKWKSDACWFLQQGAISRELFIIYQAGELLTDSSFGQWLWCIDCRGI